jgi:capsular polysaccharide transport system permease protein
MATYPDFGDGPRKLGFRGWMTALSTQGDVIGALLMRELHTRYGRENVGYLWMFLEPLMLAGAVALLHAGQPTHFGSDIRAVPFSILGYSIFIMFRGIFTRAEGALESNMSLLYHRSVTIFDILASRAVLEGAGTTATFVILIGFVTVIGLSDLPARPLELLFGICLMLWFSFAASLTCCAITHENKLVARLVHPMTYILMPLSGAFYQIAWIPEPYRTWLTYFPMALIFEQARYGQFSSATNTYTDNFYVVVVCMIMTYVGLVSIKIIRNHVHLH